MLVPQSSVYVANRAGRIGQPAETARAGTMGGDSERTFG